MKKLIIILCTILTLIIMSKIISKNDDNINKITLAEVTHSVFYSPLYVAIENGYFKDENIDLELILTPGADKVATSVLSNDVNIGFSGPEATVYIYNNSKEKLITFASLTKRDGQFVIGDCSLKNNFTMNDLKNKTILAGRQGGMPLLMFKYALKESNIKEDELIIDTSVEFAALTGAYLNNQGDIVNLFEPNALNIEKQNKGCVLASLGNISGIVPYTTFYAKEEYITNNKELIQRFNNALNKGLNFVHNNNSKTIAESIINQFPDTNINDLITIVDRYKTADSWYKNTYVNKNDYDRLLDIMLYGETITNKINPSILITNEFNKQYTNS